jgi:NAD+ synthase
MDLALWALDHDVAASELARALGIDAARAEAVYTDIRNKRRTTRYQHLAPVLIDASRTEDTSAPT